MDVEGRRTCVDVVQIDVLEVGEVIVAHDIRETRGMKGRGFGRLRVCEVWRAAGSSHADVGRVGEGRHE